MEENKQPTSAVEVVEAPTPLVESIVENSTDTKRNIHPDLLDPNKSMLKPIVVFLIPLMLSNILQSLGGVVSTMIIGKGLGETSLAAVSTILPVNFFLISLVIGLGSGSLVLIGQAYGAGKLKELSKTVDTTIKFSFLLGTVMAIIGVVFIDRILEMISAAPAIQPEASQFGKIIFASLPLIFVYVSYTTILRGTGDAKTPFVFLLISTVLNIVLTPVLTFGWLGLPQMGISGTALAYVLSTLISFVALLFYLKWKKHVLALNKGFFQNIGLDLSILKLLVKIGIPSSVQMIAISLSEVAVVFLVNEHGEQATAAYGAVIQVLNFVQMPMLSLGMAAGVFAAQFIGAGASHRLHALLRYSLGINYILGVVLIGIVYLFSNPILHLFLKEPKTIEMANDVLFAVLWALIIFGHAMILSSIMRGTGTVVVPTIITIGCIWLIMVPVAVALSEPMGLLGIWLSYPIADGIMLLILYLFYVLVWKRKQHESLFAS
ncbi:MATE family efflux transporter [Shimazuella kribbensis]|uniref:MATE family efflux transporter n=1 Tax=Shimazuella kribbensis TaxID=139808 RepID=UPI00041E6511|nr:MATE family efflux transporter [Shimazuella kribbensis]